MNEMDKFYLNTLFKEKMMVYHDHKLDRREFTAGDIVTLFDSRLKLLFTKLKSKSKANIEWLHYFPLEKSNLKAKMG